MNLIVAYLRELGRASLAGWNRFWFTPADSATLGVLRICAGSMLLYTHAVWGIGFDDFLNPAGLIPRESVEAFYGDNMRWAFSHLWLFQSTSALWAVHIAGLVVFALFTVGLFTRATSVVAWLLTLSYIHRLPGSLFGTDQMNAMLATYLMLAPCGDAYSLDRWLKARRAGGPLPDAPPSVATNIAARLIQLHMCIIYFFAGLGKLQGDTWWAGFAIWLAASNYEYQTVDLTWLAHWPILTAILTQLTCYWELFFCVLVWPRLLRPITLFIALPLHLSIGICMGLMTFGLIMPIALLSFVPPELMRRVVERRETPPVETPSEQGREGDRKQTATQPPKGQTSRRGARG